VPHASRERNEEALQYITHPSAATIYVFRDEPATEAMDESVLYVNGRLIGSTLAGTYFRLDLRPGRHRLHGFGYDPGELTLDMLSGEIYFVALNVAGLASHFALVGPEAAKRAIARCCVMLENWAPGQRPLLY
jgi:hypothetical protein